MKVPFGKYKNWHLSEVPSHFLQYLIDCKKGEEIAEAAQREFDKRTTLSSHLKPRREDEER